MILQFVQAGEQCLLRVREMLSVHACSLRTEMIAVAEGIPAMETRPARDASLGGDPVRRTFACQSNTEAIWTS
jgi:hypothetical protein